ncbi:MAG: hypothetical protein V1720_19850 [bacterium]
MNSILICEIQLADFDIERFDRIGEFSYEKMCRYLDEFKWKDEIQKMENPDTTFPSVSAVNIYRDSYFYISAVGEPDDFHFVVGLAIKEEQKGFLGFGGGKKDKMFEKDFITLDEAKQYLKLFYDDNYEEIKTLFQ